MKSIYNILIIGILCLLSTTASAQFEQLTSPPGKTTGIPEKTGTAIDCSCNYPDDYLRLLAIIDQFEGEARLEKLREQEEALKTTIEDRYGRTFDNFNEAQRAMFETSFVKPTDKRILNDLSKQLDTDIDRGQTKVDNQRHERQVLSFRNNTSDLAQFGDLRISGDTPLKIREMTPSQITSKLNTLENDLSISESFTRKRLRQQDGIRKISASGAFTTRMIDDHVNHYNSFSFEDRIKVMTKYMILARGFSIADADALRFAPVPLDASTIDYTEIAEEMAFDAGTPVPVDVSTISNDEAKALYSLGYMGPKIYQGVVENQSLLSVYRKYIESQKYDGQWLDIASNTFTTMFIRDGYPAIIPDQFAATNGMPLLQDRDNREMALSFQAERPDLRGLGNFLGSVFAISNAPNAEGSIIRDMFIHNGLTVHQDIPNWQLGDIFDFAETPLTTGDYHIQINFEAGIGIQLLQSGQAIETILQNPTIAEAGALYANGENKEERLQFFITVTSLAAQLNLTTQQRDWLIDHAEETYKFDNLDKSFEGLETYIKEIINSALEENLVTFSPFVKYPKDKAEQYKRDYPELTKLLQQVIPTIANNDKIVNEIKGITDAPIETIKEALKWGKGPEIEIQQLGGEGENEIYGVYRGAHVPELRNKLFIDIDLVNDLENLENSDQFREEIGFLIAVTILHEYNHFGDAVFGDLFWEKIHAENPVDENEAGIVFEITIFGVTVWRSNAGLVMRNFGNW
ncbi:hypothetical protein [Aquimarina aggregata]|uniref:hypothetical protein n=1 Tax=Aquimarina aggregata TaxID=1642818 RepID=UPI002492A914|nr:hypothetical protein [Aquimarina aggregata]